ncbi:hypothetical protein VNI00_018743 [Paramarasmius palmivorus]|uniref:NACHT domain-containing protein n=1 Tax=Paramarasmius palmivorus TaxID=297713 RepID=A0AAW0AXT3_9AGAR
MSDFFRNARDFTVNNGSFNSVGRDQINITNTSNPDDILNFIATHAAGNAFYNSEQRFPPPNCHPGTRVKILAELEEWMADRLTSNRVCWLHGYAGVGKSAIMQNLSEKHANPQSGEQHPRLAASFFFSRNDSTRDKLDPFVATIIYQFLTSEPLKTILGPSIIEAIRSNPKIFHTTFENQFQKLVLEPCSKVALEAWDNLPNVIVIDGLDECILIPSQERLITMIRKAIPRCRLIFLIASRPEPRICRAFDHESFTSLIHRLSVGDSPESTKDITTYFHHRFAQLQDTHHALRDTDVSWPGENAIRQLVEKACGQFIFAVTVMKYLESDDEVPTERLENILRIQNVDLPESPYPALDLLYRQVLATCRHWKDVRRILCLLVTPSTIQALQDWEERVTNLTQGADPRYSPLYIDGIDTPLRSPKCIAAILGFEVGKLESLLINLHAVIAFPGPDNGDTEFYHLDSYHSSLRIPHASFTDFLLDPSRSGCYHVEQLGRSEYIDLVAQAFLRNISIGSENYSQSTSTPVTLQRYWEFMDSGYSLAAAYGLILALERPSDAVLAALDQFDPHYFASQLLYANDYGGEFGQFKSLIAWAESLGSRTPRIFLERMKAFLCSFCIGSPDALPSQFIHVVAVLERFLYRSDTRHDHWCRLLCHSEKHMTYKIPLPSGTLTRFPYFCVGPDEDCWEYPYPNPNLTPATYHFFPVNRPPPPSWSIITITREKGETIDRLLVSLDHRKKVLTRSGRSWWERDPICSGSLCTFLIEDLQKDTAKSLHHVHLGREKANDLYELKLLVTQRRQEFGLKTSSCTLLFNSEGEASEEISDSYRPPDAELDHEDGSTGNDVVPDTLDTSSVACFHSATNALPFATGDVIADEARPVHGLDCDVYRGSVGEGGPTEEVNDSTSSLSNELVVNPTRANKTKRSVSIKDSSEQLNPDNTPLRRSSRTTRATPRDQSINQGSLEERRRGRATKHRREPELETGGAGTSSTVENRRRKRRRTWVVNLACLVPHWLKFRYRSWVRVRNEHRSTS